MRIMIVDIPMIFLEEIDNRSNKLILRIRNAIKYIYFFEIEYYIFKKAYKKIRLLMKVLSFKEFFRLKNSNKESIHFNRFIKISLNNFLKNIKFMNKKPIYESNEFIRTFPYQRYYSYLFSKYLILIILFFIF